MVFFTGTELINYFLSKKYISKVQLATGNDKNAYKIDIKA